MAERKAMIHETAVVDPGAAIGSGTNVWHFAHIMEGARIGESCTLGQNVLIGPGVEIGCNVKIQNNVSVYQGVTLEDDVFCGPSCVFTNVDRPRSAFPSGSDQYQRTRVCRGATIGANATVVCGHTIGAHAFIGAGSVVTKDVRPYAIVYGNPAREHGWACVCGAKLHFDGDTSVCSKCEREYERAGDEIRAKEELT